MQLSIHYKHLHPSTLEMQLDPWALIPSLQIIQTCDAHTDSLTAGDHLITMTAGNDVIQLSQSTDMLQGNVVIGLFMSLSQCSA